MNSTKGVSKLFITEVSLDMKHSRKLILLKQGISLASAQIPLLKINI